MTVGFRIVRESALVSLVLVEKAPALAKGVAIATCLMLTFGAAFALATPSSDGGRSRYTVKQYDTVWTIAAAHYSGDTRDAVGRIATRNHLSGYTIHAGQMLILP